MELQGAVQCFSFLNDAGLSIITFVSDRHRSIAKWIRENQPGTSHFFDIWHVARSICKKMLQVSKEGGCEKIKEWTKGVRRHLYWCATSSHSHSHFSWTTLSKGERCMRLSLCKAPTHETRPDHNTGNYVPYSFR